MQTAATMSESSVFVTSDETSREFVERFNRTSFVFRHNLERHPLFQVENLLELACRMAMVRRQDVYYDTGDVGVRQKWTTIPVRKSFKEALDQLSGGDTWIILKSAHKDPACGALLAQCIAEITRLSSRELASRIKSHVLSIILSSPRRVTPYHMDGECNFLFQIRGSKTIYVFDGNDRSVVTEQELERYWNSDRNAADYKESSESKALAVRLEPGLGVHVPLLFPHWVQNDGNVSVSVSINFEFSDTRQADLYRANHYIRKMGFQPTPPGKVAVLDSAKLALFRPLMRLRSRLS
jgi:Cupin-like domain